MHRHSATSQDAAQFGALDLPAAVRKFQQYAEVADKALDPSVNIYNSRYDNPLKFVSVVTHCPPVSLEGPNGEVTAGEILNFTANVQPDPKMTLMWTVSGGRIVTQRGLQMSLDTSGLDGQSLEVTIQAHGSCSVEGSLRLQIRPHALDSRPSCAQLPHDRIVSCPCCPCRSERTFSFANHRTYHVLTTQSAHQT
jgi:hypothetical protein